MKAGWAIRSSTVPDRAWERPEQSLDVTVDHEATGLAAVIRAMTEAKQ